MRIPDTHTVLIVSNPPPAAGLSPGFLHQPEIRLINCTHDDSAVEIARGVGPNLIIENCPTNGSADLALCLRLREDPATSGVPLILVVPPHVAADLDAVQPDALVNKPIVQREYYEAVARFLPLPRRRVLRHAVNLRFRYRGEGISGQAFTRDLSLHGAFLKTDRALSAGTRLEVSFSIPGRIEKIHCGAVVRRSEPFDLSSRLSGFAVEFEGIDDMDLVRLEQFIERQLRKPLFSF